MKLPTKIASEVQKLEQDALVDLFEVDPTVQGGDIFRFTNSINAGTALMFDGNAYPPAAVKAEGFETNGRGALPTPTLQVGNVTAATNAAAISSDDILGAKVTRIRTYRRHLDDGDDPDPEAMFPPEVYYLSRLGERTRIFVTWELTAALDQEGVKLPRRQVLRDSCIWVYRAPDGNGGFDYGKAECPYVGGSYFDQTGAPTTASGDKCGKRMSDCKLRFGEDGELPFSGFPGVARVK